MIVRNEERCLARCLDSVRDVVDEMVVVDTGSTDDTVAIAQAAGAQVHSFTWVDDFSAARNAALEHCTGDWVLILDADEWLKHGQDTVRGLREVAPEFVGVAEIESVTNDDQVALTRQGRLFPASVRFEGSIHEQARHEYPHRLLPVRVSHDGYLPAQLERKRGRNRRLLEMALEREPDSAYLHFQLGKVHEGEDRPDEASASYGAAYALGGPTSGHSPAWRHELVVRYLYSLGKAGDTQTAIDVADAELAHWQQSADFFFEVGHVLLKHALAHPEEAGPLLELIEASWLRCLELGDGHLTGSIKGKGSHLAAQNLVMFYETQGRTREADEVRAHAGRPD